MLPGLGNPVKWALLVLTYLETISVSFAHLRMIIRFLALLSFHLSHLFFILPLSSLTARQQSKQPLPSLPSTSSPSPLSVSTALLGESLILTNNSLLHSHSDSNTTTRQAALHNKTTHPSTLTHISHPPGQTVQPVPLTPPEPGLNPDAGHNPAHLASNGPRIAQIFFEVLGGIAGLVVLLAISRCIYIYKRTPASRRTPPPEIREVDRALALFRRVPFSLLPDRPPPPPYQPPPPEYNAVTAHMNGEREPRPPDRLPLSSEPVL
ncbi:hypothetical protein BU17DRAFT_80242 [Hysterangium stoloniferum]|nr:hypothetical protein BU17DRAFT_80242 [Hysterangium stoloniferum]